MTQRITAEKFELYEIDRFEDCVISYLDARKAVFENFPVIGTPKPKHHYMTHYPDSIRMFGPPLGFWTARYESKHRVAKSIADGSKNFINISLTLANRQQLRMASVLYNGMFKTDDFQVPVHVKKKCELSNTESDLYLKSHMIDTDLACTQIEWRERDFKVNDVVIIRRQDLIEMTVGVIKSIVIRHHKEVFLLVNKFKAVQDANLTFKAGNCSDGWSFINIKDLVDTYCLMKRGRDYNFLLILHHHISFIYE